MTSGAKSYLMIREGNTVYGTKKIQGPKKKEEKVPCTALLIPSTDAVREDGPRAGLRAVKPVRRAAVAEWLAYSPSPRRTEFNPRPSHSQVFACWKSCRTMPLVGGFYRGSPVSPGPFIPALLRTSTTLISSQNLVVKSCPKSLRSLHPLF
ncbi:hypothetical protein PR048_000762 [Dryococelus australis]|uniref:Uncharacterized protein n=1 Tax=Dryococelus australis TaxID=614101 RepID=A0ABQ9IFI5_9NEOP|nr:hypothetical protein PR048_000762 [Dryococelus australis]